MKSFNFFIIDKTVTKTPMCTWFNAKGTLFRYSTIYSIKQSSQQNNQYETILHPKVSYAKN